MDRSLRFQLPAVLRFGALVVLGACQDIGPTELHEPEPSPIKAASYGSEPSLALRAGREHVIPASIDASGTRDVTAQLQAFIAGVPDSSVIRFPANARYRIDYTLLIEQRRALILEGNGALLFTDNAAPFGNRAPGLLDSKNRTRDHIQVKRSSRIVLRNLRIRGANPYAGLHDLAYRSDLEAQHGVNILGSDSVLVENMSISDVYGDFVYLGAANWREGNPAVSRFLWSTDIAIRDNHFERNGRQGIAITAARRVIIERNYIGQVRRASLDIEPNYSKGGAEQILVANNVFGPGRLKFLAAAGANGTVSDLAIRDNRLDGKSMDIMIKGPPGSRRERITIARNTSNREYGSYDLPLMYFARVDDLLVTGNTNPLPAKRKMSGVRAIESCRATVVANLFAGAAREADIQPHAC